MPDYIREFGNDVDVETERSRCPVCNQRLSVVGASSPDSIGHFAHRRGSGFCPTKSSAAAPYTGLPPREPDQAAAQRIRRAFLANWQKHFRHLDWIVKGLAAQEFLDVIKIANRERIWEYAKLQEFQIPYIFATLTDFPPARSYRLRSNGQPARRYWFRCWFDATVTRYDDLWIHRESPLRFWRAWYELPPGRRKPHIEDLVDAYSLELRGEFLSEDVSLHPVVERIVGAWLSRYFEVE